MMLIRDGRLALRQLARSPGFVCVAVLTLALGIGANVSIFSIVNGVVLQPLPYDHGEELVLIRQHSPMDEAHDIGVSVPEMTDYREGNRTLAGLVEYHSLWFTLLDGGVPERVQSGVVSWDFFHVLGVRPLHGRLFLPSENAQGAEPVLLLGYGFWKSRFGGDPAVIGQSVEMNDHLHTVIGVLPPLPTYPGDNDVWMPWYACPFRSGDGWLENREWRSLTLLGRLGPDTDLAGAQTDLAGIVRRMHSDHPEAYEDHSDLRVTVSPLREELTRDARSLFLILLGVSAFVLLIACANVASLTLARMSRREHEFSVRSALGASRARLARQILIETTIIALAGGALGLLLAVGATDVITAFAARFTPRAGEVGFDGWVLLFAVGASVTAGLVTGGISAFLFARRTENAVRKQSRTATAGAGARRARGVLVISQIAITFVLLMGAGLAVRSFVTLHQVDPGFDSTNVLTMRLDLDWTTYRDPAVRRSFYRDLHERLNALPGVVSASLSGAIPLDGGVPRAPIQIEGRAPSDADATGIQIDYHVASPGYFETLKIPLLRGRTFSEADHAAGPAVAIINQSMARRHWQGVNPIGSKVSGDGRNWVTIVGVVGDVKQEGLESDFRDQAYVPMAQSPPLNANVLIRMATDPQSISRAAIDAVHSLDPRQPVAFVRTLSEVRRESIASPKLTVLLLGFFGALALVISMTGLAGLVAFSVGQRIPEIGIRMALGANRVDVLWMVMSQSMGLIALGLALGMAGALTVGRLVTGMLYGVPPTDPITFIGVSMLLLSTALGAALLPALRVTRVDPLIALTAES